MKIMNPVIEQRADPHIYLHTDGYYYFTASVPEYDRIELRRARELNELKTTSAIITAWHKPDSGPYSDLIWAPELHFINNQWFIYFAAAPSREIKDDAFQHRMYVIGNANENPLEGEWQFLGQVETGIDAFCLDATTFTHNDKLYYLWAQKHPDIRGNSSLYIAEMKSPTELLSQPVLISKPELDWETRGFWVNEGPSVIKRNGRIFVSYSASATDENYCMGLLYIDQNDDLLNPNCWHKSPQPVFQTSWEKNVFLALVIIALLKPKTGNKIYWFTMPAIIRKLKATRCGILIGILAFKVSLGMKRVFRCLVHHKHAMRKLYE